MPKLKILVGQKFNRLLVLSKAKSRKGFTYWNVQCDCGTLKPVMGMSLVKKNTQSCGCLRRDVQRGRNGAGNYNAIYSRLVKMAGFANVDVKLTHADYIEFTKLPHCHYCKTVLYWPERGGHGPSYGYNLDRKDNTIGY